VTAGKPCCCRDSTTLSPPYVDLVAVRLAGGDVHEIATAGKPCCYRDSTTLSPPYVDLVAVRLAGGDVHDDLPTLWWTLT
jgi:hypothetical protein